MVPPSLRRTLLGAFSRLSVSKAEWSELGDRICHAKFIH